jgi:hypothetical protein
MQLKKCCTQTDKAQTGCNTGKKSENPYKIIAWKLYGPLLEIEWILMIHNNCIYTSIL